MPAVVRTCLRSSGLIKRPEKHGESNGGEIRTEEHWSHRIEPTIGHKRDRDATVKRFVSGPDDPAVVESGRHSMQFLYVPSTSGEGTTVFATNLRVGPDEAESFCRRYSRRWQIENEYKSIKGYFLAKTSSKDYRVRLFYFVFAVLLYNIWRLTDFLLKAGVDGEMDYAPVLTAGECVEIVVSALILPD